MDDSLPLIPTDLTIHLVEEDDDEEGEKVEEEEEEGFQVVREPLQVRQVSSTVERVCPTR